MTSLRSFTIISVVCALVPLAACGSRSAPTPAAAGAGAAGKHVDADSAGIVSGRTTFSGTPPAAESIRMSADPACVQAAGGNNASDTAVVAGDGSLANVFVYVKDAFDGYTFDKPTAPVLLNQKGCRYIPHVFGVRVGQPVEFLNSDNTPHNVHGLPSENAEFNRGEPAQGTRIRQTFTTPEIMIPIKCNLHGWMTSYAGVVAHPFFAVSATDGSFSIPGLPPGTYTIEAWHELYGSQSQQITIAGKQTQTIAFTFSAK
jgi:plastocyanin